MQSELETNRGVSGALPLGCAERLRLCGTSPPFFFSFAAPEGEPSSGANVVDIWLYNGKAKPFPGVSTFSRVGGVGEVAVGELEAEGLGAFGVVDQFLAQQGDEVEAGGAVGPGWPTGQGLIGLCAFGAKAWRAARSRAL